MNAQFNTLLRDVRLLANQSIFPEVNEAINDLTLLIKLIGQKELTDALAQLEQIAPLPEEELKEQFTLLCRARAENGCATFVTHPESPCNVLYFNLCRALYPTASFQVLFQLLMPHIRTQWVVELSVKQCIVTGSRQKGVEVMLLKKAITENDCLACLPATLASFNRLIILEHEVFALDEIENFNFRLHQEFYQQVKEKCHPLIKAIMSYNESFAELYSNIERLSDDGATVREFIEPIMRRMAISGTNSGTGEFASVEGSIAAERLVIYHEHLPTAIKLTIDACQSLKGTRFSTVIQHIKSLDCIETAAADLKGILENPVNCIVFDCRPHLTEDEVKRLTSRYTSIKRKPIVNFDSFSSPTVLFPSVLTRSFYRQIVIENINQLVEYLIILPASEYIHFLSQVNVQFDLSAGLKDILPILSEIQHQAFVDSLIHLVHRFGLWELVLGFAIVEEVSAVQALLSPQSPDERFALFMKTNRGGDNMLHCLLETPKGLQLILNWVPEDRCAFLVNQKGMLHSSLLHCSVARKYKTTLSIILNRVPSPDRFSVINQTDLVQNTVLHYAVEDPASLEIILHSLPENLRLPALMIEGRYGKNALKLALGNVQSLWVIFRLALTTNAMNFRNYFELSASTRLMMARVGLSALKHSIANLIEHQPDASVIVGSLALTYGFFSSNKTEKSLQNSISYRQRLLNIF